MSSKKAKHFFLRFVALWEREFFAKQKKKNATYLKYADSINYSHPPEFNFYIFSKI
jgi:hypothetical protein